MASTARPADAQLIEDLAVIAGMVAVITDERAAEINGQLGAADPSAVRARGADRAAKSTRPDQALQGRHAGGARRRRADRHHRPLGAGAAAAVGRSSTGATASSRSAAPAAIGSCRRAARRHKVQVLPPHVAELSKHMIDKAAAGPVAAAAGADAGAADRLDVAVGDKVEPGQPVAVMEAMKMENILRAGPRGDGQGDPGQGRRQPRGRSGHRGV